MKLITVEASFNPDAVEAAVDAINAQAGTVRDMHGCEGYGHYRSGETVAIVQKWHSMSDFDAYRESDTFAALIASLKPAMAAPPVTTIASVDTL